MQTPYQQFAVPQAVGVAYSVAVPAPAQSSESSPCCPCCVEPACCSRVGACPCFCSGYTAAFSVALASIWMALPMLATAIGLTDMFEISLYGIETVFLGMWQACGYDSTSYYYSCSSYSSDDLGLLSSSTAAQFNAMRSLAVVATAFTLLTGILGAIRLARLQRAKPNSPSLNNWTLLSALLSLGSAGGCFGLTFPLVNTLSDQLGQNQWGLGTSWGLSWVMLVVGVGLLVVGVGMHMIAHCCYQYNVVNGSESGDDEAGEQPGMGYAVNGYPASSIFAHPQPLQHAVLPVPAVYYPTATAAHYPLPQYVQPPMGHIYQ